MKKLILLLLIVHLCTVNLFSRDTTSISVIDLTGQGISEPETQIISSRLRAELFKTKKYVVLEREQMDEILKEQGFQLSGCNSNECYIEIGKLIGVNQIIAGEIGKIGDLFTMNIRSIDVETGQVLNIVTDDCECEIEDVLRNSVRNVAQILSGNRVQSANYWKAIGIPRDKWIEFVRVGLTLDDWDKYKGTGIKVDELIYIKQFGLVDALDNSFKTGITEWELSGISIDSWIIQKLADSKKNSKFKNSPAVMNEFVEWKEEVYNHIKSAFKKNTAFFLWAKYKERNKLNISAKEWANELTITEWYHYKTSKKSIDEWLNSILDKQAST